MEFKEQRVVNDKASIDYLVNTGKRHKLVSIEINGQPVLHARKRSASACSCRRPRFLQFPHGRYSENLLRRDEDSIVNLYQSNGFRDVKVTHQLDGQLSGQAGQYRGVPRDSRKGRSISSTACRWMASSNWTRRAILAALSSVAGQPFSEFNVAVDRDTILAQYFEKGFRNATFEWSSKPAAEPNRVDLHYVVHEGSSSSCARC